MSVTARTALVTGANRGIGLELVRALSTRGFSVIAVCRSSSPELDSLASSNVHVETGIDVSEDAMVETLSARLKGAALDWVIANAGVMQLETIDDLSFESMRTQLEVNTLGPLRTVKAVSASLKPGAKIGLVTSRMGSIADNGSGGYYGYRMSKAALNAAGVSLARDLKHRDIAVAILHPGFVRTGMTAGHGQLDPSESARLLLERMDGLNSENSGTFWHANGDVLPW